MNSDLEKQNMFDSTHRTTFSEVTLAPNRFYIFDRKFEKVTKSFNMDVILENPLYAYVGDDKSLRSRVIALLRPEQIEIQSPADTWVIVLVGSNINDPQHNKLSFLQITENYSLVEPNNRISTSYWKISNSSAKNITLHTIVFDPSHSIHRKYWHFDTTSVNLNAYYNANGDNLRITGILIPAFSRMTEVKKLDSILATGYRVGKDPKVGVIPLNEVILIDNSLLEF